MVDKIDVGEEARRAALVAGYASGEVAAENAAAKKIKPGGQWAKKGWRPPVRRVKDSGQATSNSGFPAGKVNFDQ